MTGADGEVGVEGRVLGNVGLLVLVVEREVDSETNLYNVGGDLT